MKHCTRNGVLLATVQAANEDRHDQRRDLVISPTAIANSVDERGDLFVGKCFIITLCGDYFLRTHKFSKFRTVRLKVKRARRCVPPSFGVSGKPKQLNL